MISNFISQVKHRGLARTNRYDVIVIFPYKNATTETMTVASLFCDSVNLPGANISTNPQRVFGEPREMPYEKIYDPVTLSFYVDSGMEIKTAFDDWMNMVVDTDKRTIGYYRDFTSLVHIYVRTVNNQAPYMCTLYEAYPKTINAIQLDSSSRDVMKLSVTMQYKYWKPYTKKIFTPVQNAIDPYNISTQSPPNQDLYGNITGNGYASNKNYSLTDPVTYQEPQFDPPLSQIIAATPNQMRNMGYI